MEKIKKLNFWLIFYFRTQKMNVILKQNLYKTNHRKTNFLLKIFQDKFFKKIFKTK